MKEKIKNIIESLVLKKYPEIVSIDEISNLSENHGLEMYEHNYHVSMTTSECLDTKKMMAIDSQIKILFKMLSVENSNPFGYKTPSIGSFFDCGDGEGYTFSGEYGYKH